MKKNIFKTLLLFSLSGYLQFLTDLEDTKLKLDDFSDLVVQEGLDYLINDEVYIIYDFDYINDVSNKLFINYKIVNQTSTSFDMEVKVTKSIFTKVLVERYQIVKGEKL